MRAISFACFAAAIIAVQVATTLTGTGYLLNQLTMAAWNSLVVVGLCLLMGYAGQISLGHAAFFAIGGYTTAVLSSVNLLPAGSTLPVRALSLAGLTIGGTDPWGSAVLRCRPGSRLSPP